MCHDGEQPINDAGDTVCRENSLGHKTVKLIPQNWGSTMLNGLIVQILLMEQLQIPVETVQFAAHVDPA